MKKIRSIALLIVTTSALFTQTSANASTTLGLQGFTGTLIDNKWTDDVFDLSTLGIPGLTGFQTTRKQSAKPYTMQTSDGLGTMTLSPIVDFEDNSHIHVNGGDGNPGTQTTPYIHGDVGGVFFDGSGSHEKFSFQSMNILTSALQSNGITHQHPTITVRGFLGGTNNMMTGVTEADGTSLLYKGGTQVAETTLNNGVTGSINFLTADAGFAEVDYVEFFFTDFYRFKPASSGDTSLAFYFDDVVIGEVVSIPPPATVPVPAAVWLFGTGLIGLTSLRKRKKA